MGTWTGGWHERAGGVLVLVHPRPARPAVLRAPRVRPRPGAGPAGARRGLRRRPAGPRGVRRAQRPGPRGPHCWASWEPCSTTWSRRRRAATGSLAHASHAELQQRAERAWLSRRREAAFSFLGPSLICTRDLARHVVGPPRLRPVLPVAGLRHRLHRPPPRAHHEPRTRSSSSHESVASRRSAPRSSAGGATPDDKRPSHDPEVHPSSAAPVRDPARRPAPRRPGLPVPRRTPRSVARSSASSSWASCSPPSAPYAALRRSPGSRGCSACRDGPHRPRGGVTRRTTGSCWPRPCSTRRSTSTSPTR